jgi:hypothetical protein
MAELIATRERPSGIVPSKARSARRFWGPFVAALVGGLLIAGCEISPVVSDVELPTNRYIDCDRAAKAYCEHVVEATPPDLEKCVAEYRFKCVAGSSK